MPDEIQVRVTMSNKEGKYDYTFPVKIEKFDAAKSYLGGYRNKLNGF